MRSLFSLLIGICSIYTVLLRADQPLSHICDTMSHAATIRVRSYARRLPLGASIESMCHTQSAQAALAMVPDTLQHALLQRVQALDTVTDQACTRDQSEMVRAALRDVQDYLVYIRYYAQEHPKSVVSCESTSDVVFVEQPVSKPVNSQPVQDVSVVQDVPVEIEPPVIKSPVQQEPGESISVTQVIDRVASQLEFDRNPEDMIREMFMNKKPKGLIARMKYKMKDHFLKQAVADGRKYVEENPKKVAMGLLSIGGMIAYGIAKKNGLFDKKS